MSRRVCRLFLSTDSLARIGTFLSAGMAIVARMPMMAITMISSSSVKPRCRLWALPWGKIRMGSLISSPLPIEDAVQARALRERVDVEDVLSTPGGGVRRVLVAAEPPLVLAGHRIDGDPAQELELLVHLADELHPLDQHVQLLGGTPRCRGPPGSGPRRCSACIRRSPCASRGGRS